MEIFKDIDWTNGKYSVSDKGKVKNNITNKILNQTPYQNGYLSVTLCAGNKRLKRRVHRLVAEAFIPTEDKTLQINHKDENKLNNNVDNLEWCTGKYNKNYGTRNKRISRRLSQKVRQYSKDGQFIKEYDSIIKASIAMGMKNSSNLNKACNGKQKTCKGYIWKKSI